VEALIPQINTTKTAHKNTQSQAYATAGILNALTATKQDTTAETRTAQRRIFSIHAKAMDPESPEIRAKRSNFLMQMTL